ncbi:MAG TPA: amidohydrolase family protein [Rhizomicrobium sp.]|jgi:L-fuconolactonase|nr:amidohydrolase family protein [Rhizomicrobium sp.]
MRIDAHQHFWRMDRGDYGWLTAKDHPKIARDFLPADLAPLLAAARIDKTILVQAAPTDAETQFLLEIAAATPFVAGVVGWSDFEAPDTAMRIARLCANPKLKGLRPMVQDMADDEWLLRPSLARAFEAMQRGRLRFDALVKPRHLPALAEFLDRYPALPVVIDHAAKPDIAHAGLDLWASYIRHIAKSSKAVCKLSGLVTEAGTGWSASTLKLYVDVLLESFGPSRLMWGSDWPVLNEAGDYAGWLAAGETLTKHLSSADREAIFGGTAAKFYGIDP